MRVSTDTSSVPSQIQMWRRRPIIQPVSDRTADAALPKIRVIIGDSDALARRGLRDALQSPDITVIAAAADGREMVELSEHYRPDVVLVDAGLPGIDGIEATRRIVR